MIQATPCTPLSESAAQKNCQTFIANINAAMSKHCVTQSDIAAATGIHQSDISRILAGRKKVSLAIALRLASCFDRDWTLLFFLQTEMFD